MNTFEIISWVNGKEQNIRVTEPLVLDMPVFKLTFDQASQNENLIVRLEDGHWSLLSSAKNKTIHQLEIDSIGYQIARHWCNRLEQQLAAFQICI